MQGKSYCIIHGTWKNDFVISIWKWSVIPILRINFLACNEAASND